jgi:hypothetical protein
VSILIYHIFQEKNRKNKQKAQNPYVVRWAREIVGKEKPKVDQKVTKLNTCGVRP